MGRHVALLRGINVGGKNSLPMPALAALFADAGCTEVTTYIQSGNVIFSAPTKALASLASTISKRIASEHRLEVPVVIRSAARLAEVATNNPYVASTSDPKALHVMFLADAPTAQAVAGLDPERSPGDAFTVVGSEIYLRCPNGLGRSKLTNAYFDSRLGTTSTCRNWNTVLTLVEKSR